VVGLDDIVQIFDLPVLHILEAFAFCLQFRDGGPIGRRLVGIDLQRLLTVFQPLKRLAEKAFGDFSIARWGEIKIDSSSVLVDGAL